MAAVYSYSHPPATPPTKWSLASHPLAQARVPLRVSLPRLEGNLGSSLREESQVARITLCPKYGPAALAETGNTAEDSQTYATFHRGMLSRGLKTVFPTSDDAGARGCGEGGREFPS